jgi:hypothetical protein
MQLTLAGPPVSKGVLKVVEILEQRPWSILRTVTHAMYQITTNHDTERKTDLHWDEKSFAMHKTVNVPSRGS